MKAREKLQAAQGIIKEAYNELLANNSTSVTTKLAEVMVMLHRTLEELESDHVQQQGMTLEVPSFLKRR